MENKYEKLEQGLKDFLFWKMDASKYDVEDVRYLFDMISDYFQEVREIDDSTIDC